MLSPLIVAKKILIDAGQVTDQRALVSLIVRRIRQALKVDVCSLYLMNERQQLVLSATEGLSQEAIGRIRMNLGEGLVGTIAQRQHLLNLTHADQYPSFKYFAESGEEIYQGFLGVPMIHHGEVLGVLVVQVTETRRFSEEEEAFLITMGAHLVASQSIQLMETTPDGQDDQVRRMRGISGSPGTTIARAWVVRDDIHLEDIEEREGSGLEFERKRIKDAVNNTLEELDADESTHVNSETLSSLLEVYRLLLGSPELQMAIEAELALNVSASTALKRAMLNQIAVFDAIEDPYLKARADDLRVLAVRVYRALQNLEPEVIDTDEPVILVGENITVEHFTKLDARLIAGVVSNQGSKLSHTSVLANALGIPAVVGLKESRLKTLHGNELILDGHRGHVIANPPEQIRQEFERLIRQEAARQADLAHLKNLPAETTDGERIRLFSNTGLLADITPGLDRGSEGVGLYRSEIPFMVHNTFPTEEEQVRIYRGVLEAYAPKPVVMRTLDVGGDKALPYFPIQEENPFLGWRGIRFTLDYRNIQLDQIRAMLLANIGHDNLQIMVPMLSHEDELLRVHALIDEAIRQLKEEGHPVHKPPVGIMAEVPAVIWMLPRLRDNIDFVSIGSNDLTQYLLAVDRNNPRVAHLYSHFHPAVLSAMHDIVRECRRLNLTVSVCGEMAADPKAVLLLLGMGVKTLSMSAFKLPQVKWLVRRVSIPQCRQILDEARDLGRDADIQAMLSRELKELGYNGQFE
ncbi:phosphoenolpyruvate--protein phosphotransferase [Reinekea blandensis]|uniref:phosphoenolpyruvate--protein phosphotransferase n=1 Tax=Reinekea blandensis MED297 TaxID=314283 RepID=A4BAS1_9GAMM|nr:phosphoenolpyruvate--protein phosphotransferase [Reinekea blandensis]EAR11027.1 phosphotransferase system enzyme I PtsP [Reinekea sp. MED297] [Reinekea blandensis MED297]